MSMALSPSDWAGSIFVRTEHSVARKGDQGFWKDGPGNPKLAHAFESFPFEYSPGRSMQAGERLGRELLVNKVP